MCEADSQITSCARKQEETNEDGGHSHSMAALHNHHLGSEVEVRGMVRWVGAIEALCAGLGPSIVSRCQGQLVRPLTHCSQRSHTSNVQASSENCWSC